MAFILYKQDGEILYGIKEFLIDSEEDLKDLPLNIKSGSSAFILSSGSIYILNKDKKWILVGGESSSNDILFDELDQNKNGVIDKSETTISIEMQSF